MTAKRKPGRPRGRDPEMSVNLNLRCKPEERQLWHEAAEAADMSLSDWVRARLNNAAKRAL